MAHQFSVLDLRRSNRLNNKRSKLAGKLTRQILTCVLVALDGSRVTLKLDDLSNELFPTNLHELEHLCARHVLGNDHYNEIRA